MRSRPVERSPARLATTAPSADLPFRTRRGLPGDVTELVGARSAIEDLTRDLLDQHAFDRALLDAVDVGIATTDARGALTYANRAARDFVLLDEDGLGTFDLARALSIELPAVDGPTVVSRELASREGLPRQVEITVRAGDPSHEALSFLFVLRDVTRERALQAEIRLVEHLAAMGTMVAGFAHEVRNPVASLRTIAESLDEDLAECGVHVPHAKWMLQVLARIERLVTTSLQFGRPASPRRAPHRPWTLISTALSTVSARTLELGGEVRVEVEPDLPDVFVDDGQLVQVLVILLNNALDATGSTQSIVVRALSSRDREPRSATYVPGVLFEVQDDGPGVPADVAPRIFDPFFTTKASGTGLGLSIAQQIVSENGARLELSSRANPTVFAVVCPVRDGD